jgi:adenine C2-methylase RlmN of 23S rRNA A2503 and tRNA A37
MRDMLVNNSFVTVVRNSRGRDIHAACGQLRSAAATPNNCPEFPVPKQ